MEPTECNSFTGSGPIVSKWHTAAATATVITRSTRRPTTRVILSTTSGTGYAVRRKQKWAWKRCNGNGKWRKRGRRGHTRAICASIRCPCSSDTRATGAHVRRGSLGPARFTRDDQKCGSGSGTIVRWYRPWYDGTRHAAARVRRSRFVLSFLADSLRRNLYSTFITPWADSSAAHSVEPDFHLPGCYSVQPPPPGPGKAAAFSDETLFFMFYSSPRDALQEVAAQEL